jgi:hypothetical protein
MISMSSIANECSLLVHILQRIIFGGHGRTKGNAAIERGRLNGECEPARLT